MNGYALQHIFVPLLLRPLPQPYSASHCCQACWGCWHVIAVEKRLALRCSPLRSCSWCC